MSDKPGNRPPGGHSLHEPGDHPRSRGPSLDLEVGRADQRTNALAGVRPDTDTSFTFNRRRLSPALARPDELAQGADFVRRRLQLLADQRLTASVWWLTSIGQIQSLRYGHLIVSQYCDMAISIFEWSATYISKVMGPHKI